MKHTVKGGFQRSVRILSVAKNGYLRHVANSWSCTYRDNAPSRELSYDDEEPLLIVGTSYDSQYGPRVNATAKAYARLAKVGLTPEQAHGRFREIERIVYGQAAA